MTENNIYDHPNTAYSDMPEKQNEIITKIEYAAELTTGSKWCLLTTDWWNHWCAYTGHQQKQGLTYSASKTHVGDSSRPGPIDNSSLVTDVEPTFGYSSKPVKFVDPDGKTIQESIPLRLNSRYLQGFHFLWISELSWNHLHTWFGGGPTIKRNCISDQKGTKTIEENPLTLRVFQLFDDNDDNDEVEEDTEDCENNYFYLTFSKGDTLEELFAKIAKKLNLDLNLAKKAAGLLPDSVTNSDVSIKTIGNFPPLPLEEGNDPEKGKNKAGEKDNTENTPLESESEDSPIDDSQDHQSASKEDNNTNINPKDSTTETPSGSSSTGSTESDFDADDADDNENSDATSNGSNNSSKSRNSVPWRVWRLASNIHIEKISVAKDWSEKVSNVQLHERSALCVEFQNSDGSWPRGGPRPSSQSQSTDSMYSISSNRSRSRVSTSLYSQNSSHNHPYMYSGSSYMGGSSYSKPSSPGLCGLSNLGNTCFMNSGLQCLSNSSELINFFISGKWTADLNPSNPLGMKGRVATAFGNLMKAMWSGQHSVVTPSEFKSTIGQFASQFSGYSQHDSQELLSFLLDGLHEDLNRVKEKPSTSKVEDTTGEIPDIELASESWNVYLQRNKSIIVDLFQGQYKSRLECPTPNCGHISITFDPFMYLSLPIPGKSHQDVELVVVNHWDHNNLPDDHLSQFPVSYTVSVKKGANFKTLTTIVSKKTGIPADSFAVCSLTGASITKQFKNEDIIPDTTYTNIRFFVFDENSTNLIVTARHKIKPMYWSYSTPTLKKIGEPFLLHLSKQPGQSTFRHVYDQLFAQIRYYLKPNWRELVDEHYPPENESNESDTTDSYPSSTNDSPQSSDPLANTSPDQSVDNDNGNNGKEEESAGTTDAISRGGIGSGMPQPSSKQQYNVDEDSDEDSEEDTYAYNSTLTKTEFKLSRFSDGTPILFEIKTTDNYGHRINPPEDPFDTTTDLSSKWPDDRQIFLDWHTDIFNLVANSDDYTRTVESSSADTDGNIPKKGKDSIDIYGALNLFCEQEILSKDDTWFCSKCKNHVQATKKFDLWKVPKLLVIHLKRFRYGSAMYGWRTKIDTYVDFPLEGLDLAKFVQGPQNTSPLLYDCYAVSQHYGFGGGGHYTACGKNPNGKWYNFDDSRVSEISKTEAATSAAYVLFYRLRENGDSNTGAVEQAQDSVLIHQKS